MDSVIAVPEPGDSVGESSDDKALGDDRSDGGDVDAVRELDRWADGVRQHHLRNALETLDERDELDDDTRAALAACSRALVDELLRAPRWRLRTAGDDVAETATDLFDLDSD